MARLASLPKIELRLTLSISEGEARALDALVGYGDDDFIKAFYEKLGKAYMSDHEDSLREFFQSVRTFMPGLLSQADTARKAFITAK